MSEIIKDFGSGPMRYRAAFMAKNIGMSVFERLDDVKGWRPVRNGDQRRALWCELSGSKSGPLSEIVV